MVMIIFNGDPDPKCVIEGPSAIEGSQLWLPFWKSVRVLDAQPAKPPEAPEKAEARKYADRVKIRERLAKPFARPSETRPIYTYEKGVPQHVLPFIEFRAIGTSEWKRVSAAEFPGFELTDTGTPFAFSIEKGRRREIIEWCRHHCSGRFHISNARANFQFEMDAVFARFA